MDYELRKLEVIKKRPKFALDKHLTETIMETKETWKLVTIGGVAGIQLGSALSILANKVISLKDPEVTLSVRNSEPKIARAFADNTTFQEAFEGARAEQGPGGLFTWKGNLYNTYTAEEWQNMSEEEHDLFTSRIHIESFSTDSDVTIQTDVEVDDLTEGITMVDESEMQESEKTIEADVTSWDDLENDDNDVRIVGYDEIDLDNGQSVIMQELEVNGQRVAIIDVDKDGEADFAMTDLNHNYQMDDGEVIDLHTGEAISFTNEATETENVSDIDTFNI